MEENTLFNINQSDGNIELIYFPDHELMPADELGEAIIGLEKCLKEAAKIGLLYHEGVYIEPIRKGSIKTKLVYVKKHPLTIIVGLDIVMNLFNNSFQLIDRFGSNSMKNPSKEILEQITDKRVLDLCRSLNFRSGLQKVAQPLNEENNKVQIILSDNVLQITCDNKYQFYVDKQEDVILPELKNGEEVSIEGEITRINKKLNDLGFIYKNYTLNVSPLDGDKSTSKFHEYLESDKVKLTGIVIRDNEYQIPKIKVIEIASIKDAQQKLDLDEK